MCLQKKKRKRKTKYTTTEIRNVANKTRLFTCNSARSQWSHKVISRSCFLEAVRTHQWLVSHPATLISIDTYPTKKKVSCFEDRDLEHFKRQLISLSHLELLNLGSFLGVFFWLIRSLEAFAAWAQMSNSLRGNRHAWTSAKHPS